MSELKKKILALRNSVLNHECDIVNVLFNAHVVAKTFGFNDFDDWITTELDGYQNGARIPEYRHFQGVLKAGDSYNHWVIADFCDAELEQQISEQVLVDPISKIVSLSNKDYDNRLILSLPEQLQATLNSVFQNRYCTQFALFIPTDVLVNIVNAVKREIIDWTIKIEAENINRDNMQRTSDWQKSEKNVQQTVKNYGSGTIIIIGHGATVGSIAGNNNQVNFNYEDLRKTMSAVESAIEEDTGLSEDDKKSARELLADINSKIEKQAKPTVIQILLKAFKDFLIGAGSCVVAGLILA